MTNTDKLKHYRRGWRAGKNPSPTALERADKRRENCYWYAGFFDAEAGRPMYATLQPVNA